jgi:hypothetical protein
MAAMSGGKSLILVLTPAIFTNDMALPPRRKPQADGRRRVHRLPAAARAGPGAETGERARLPEHVPRDRLHRRAGSAGRRVVTSDLGGIPETAAGFARLVPTGRGRDKYLERFVEETVQVLSTLAGPDTAQAENRLRRQVTHVNQNCTWALRAEEWVRWLSRARARVPAGQPA